MATSAHFKLYFFLTVTALYSPPTLASCLDIFSGAFIVFDWDDEVPKSALLSKYEKNSKFTSPRETYSSDYMGEKLKTPSGRTYLRVLFKDHEVLSYKYDYKLVINNKIEFNVYEIKPEKKQTLRCQLESAMVNNCAIDASSGIQVEKKCGKSLEN
ncbi:hypothetical protein [Chitinimonas taiwanensis]|uniref:hypothetical protein n=1 Tax=Chitinimonas taiwanensis TaxID=240412 RepID=UPI0035B27789